MTKRVLSVLAGAALFLSAVSCNKDEDGDGGSVKKTSSSLSGDYATLNGIASKVSIFDEDVDEGLKIAIAEYKDSGLASLRFKDGEFEALGNYDSSGGYGEFGGSYSVKDGRIIFNYEKYHSDSVDVSVGEDLPEADMDVVKGTSDKLDGLSKEERTQLVKEETQKRARKAWQDRLIALTKQESYWNWVAPKIEFSDKISSFTVFPRFVQRIYGSQKSDDIPVQVYAVGDFICVPTYGFEIDGSYRSGKDFKVSFDPLAACFDDEYSRMNISMKNFDDEAEAKEFKESRIERIESEIGAPGKTTIEFSDGKWTWKNSEGEIVNNGRYLESSEHKGLVAMFIDESSKNYDKTYFYLRPLFFYVDGDNTVWYPNWVKMD